MEYQDITKTGPVGLKGLKGLNRVPEMGEFELSVLGGTRALQQSLAPSTSEEVGIELADKGYGQSIYDEDINFVSQADDLNEVRAIEQPWYAQLGAGLAKGAVLTGTTFLDGTVGLVLGAGTAINEGRWSGLWDNDFSKAMQSVNEWSEEALPNYYTRDEQEEPWYENIFTANFIGDKFIKNLGFSVGAFYSGNITAAGLKASKLPQLIGAIKNSSKAPAIVNSAVGATISSVNEGRIEALNNSKDWFELQKAQLDDKYNQRMQAIGDAYGGTEMYNQLVSAESQAYNEALEKLSEDRLKMGNADLLMNIPVLLASNITQFGKLYANGFKTARKTTNIMGKAGEYTAGTTRLGTVAAITRGALSEGAEEMAQSIASRTAGNYYSTDVNNFYKSKTDPEASQETLDWVKAFAQGVNETVNEGSSWEEFFIGALTGALGMPRFRSMRNKQGGIQSPITIEGGAINEWRDYNERMAREERIANYMNDRVNSPEFKNYYQGLIRHNKYQNDMNRAAEQGDEFNFKNAEHAQLVSDIAMFDNAGRMEDLNTLIDAAFDTSDENLASIVENTTTTLEDGSKVGPFVDKNGNPMYATPEGKQEMIEKLQQNHDEMTKTISDYLKIRDDVDIRTGQQLSDDQLEELTWMKSQIGNWAERATAMSGEVKSAIGNVIGNLNSFLRFNQQVRSSEGQSHKGLSEGYQQADNNIRAIEKAINTLSFVKGQEDNVLPRTLIDYPKFTKGLINEINEVDDTVLSGDEKEDIITKINDIVKLGNASEVYNNKLNEYLRNPQKQIEDHIKAGEQAAQQEAEKKSNDLKASLSSAQNLQEFRAILDDQDDIVNRNNTLKDLEDEGNEMAKNYRETSQYNNEVSRIIQSSDEEPQVKQDAIKLLQDQFNNSENLEQMANPNSIFINNDNAFDEDSEGDIELSTTRFQEAQYALQKAMSQVNDDNRFKDRFSPEYRKPVEKREGTTRGDNRRDTTGDSGTPTVPVVTSSEDLPVTEVPVGNVTPEMVNEENKKANERVEAPQRPSRDRVNQFYRPAIPELHIEASKEGDFRPFDVVVGEREKGVDFSGIYGYLRDQDTFRYLNEGNLKVGDELGFMIDPDFNDKTIFIIDRKNNQVVGSLDESDYSVSRYEGLKGLEERIKDEFANRENKAGKFIATPVTRVSKMMVGRIPYGSTERSLKDIPNVSSEDRRPVFGIIKNGVLTTNGKVNDSLVIKPVDMGQKEGRLYLLVPNGAGKYSPAAVRVKHFNESEYNPEDVTINSTPLYKNIKKSIDALANAFTEEDVNNAVKDLARSLYIGDVHIDFIQGKNGNGIRFTKVQRDANKNEIYDEIGGKRVRREDSRTVFLTERWDPNVIYELGGEGVKTQPDTRDSQEVASEIQNILMAFNLPLQVNLGMLNKGGYNNMLLSSGVMTSNIVDASVKSNWFTTDYFDIQGNLQQALNPASVKPEEGRKIQTPVGGTEGAIAGTTVSFDNTTYYVDLTSNTVRDNNGRTLNSFPESILDMAYIQENYGDAQNGSMMMGGITLLPNGKVLNRNTGQYVTGAESDKFKQKLADRKKTVADSKKVIDQIAENQAKVDKTRTDGEFYYILEDDGKYHEYKRVHSVLGSNWVESPKQTKALQDLRVNLSKNADNITQFNNYLKNLSKHYGVDLTAFEGKIDARSRDTIVNIVRDKMSGTNSQRALEAGTSVDSVIRNFFTSSEMPVKPSNMSEQAFNDLVTSLTEIKSNIEARGETFLTNNIVLFNKYENGNRVAGEVDILSVDANGNFKIYDVKTSRYSFYDFVDRNGRKVNYFKNKSNTQTMSQEQYYTKQLSAYKNLFESQYHTPITTLAILPFVLEYNKENVSRVNKEKGILLNYDSSVNVPLVGSVATPEVNNTNSSLPIFNSTFETREPINNVLPDYSMSDSKVGYFLRDGKLHTGYLSPIGKVNGVEIYITKVPNITKGFGNQPAHVASNDFYAVFPNGNTIALVKNAVLSYSETEAKNNIKKILEGNPQRVLDMSQESTILYTPSTEPVKIEKPVTPATINQGESNGAASTVAKEQTINQTDEEFDVEFELRQVDDLSRPIWDKDKELAWLKRVLPQLSENELVKIQEGLIEVAKTGALAWGQFSRGVITLSDIAAEGTTYHEAFHAVFNLLTDTETREALYAEARQKFGNRDNAELEELMAEDFREYVMTQEDKGLGRKLLDFFKSLFAKVTNWKSMQPSLIQYYRNINEGHYSSSDYKVSTLNNMRGRGLWHTSDNIIYKFKREFPENFFAKRGGSPRAIFFTDRVPESQSFLSKREVKSQYDVVINNPLIVEKYDRDAEGAPNMASFVDAALQAGNDGVIFRDIYDNQMYGDVYVAFNPDQINYIAGQSGEVSTYGPIRFADMNSDIVKSLVKKGWTEEMWNSISQEEREQAIRCS